MLRLNAIVSAESLFQTPIVKGKGGGKPKLSLKPPKPDIPAKSIEDEVIQKPIEEDVISVSSKEEDTDSLNITPPPPLGRRPPSLLERRLPFLHQMFNSKPSPSVQPTLQSQLRLSQSIIQSQLRLSLHENIG